jgi:hypothetical protein
MSKCSRLIVFGCFIHFIISCKQHQDARKPLSHTWQFMKKSIERNKKKLVASEETILRPDQRDPRVTYIASKRILVHV